MDDYFLATSAVLNDPDDPVNRTLKLLEECEPWVVGGVVRNLILGFDSIKDIDIVVSNYHFEKAVSSSEQMFGSQVLNRHGNPRFTVFGGHSMDLFCPSRFYDVHEDIDSLLDAFDYSVNSVAYSLDYGLKLNLSSEFDLRNGILRPVERSWACRSGEEYADQLYRGCKLVKNHSLTPVNKGIYFDALKNADFAILKNKYNLTREIIESILQL